MQRPLHHQAHLAVRRYMRGWTLARSTWLVAAGFSVTFASGSIDAQTNSAPEVRASGAGSPTENLLNSRFVFTLGGFVVLSNINGSLSGTANTAGRELRFCTTHCTRTD